MKHFQILLVGGYLQSGKDLAANYICKNYGFERFGFADCLKDEVSEKFGLARESLDTSTGKEVQYDELYTVRDLLIKYGNEKREVDPAYWIKKVIQKIEQRQSNNSKVIIPDFRYPLEYHFCKMHFPSSVISTMKICRYTYPKRTDLSETSLENFTFDYYIDNSKDIAHFYTNLNSCPFILNFECT